VNPQLYYTGGSFFIILIVVSKGKSEGSIRVTIGDNSTGLGITASIGNEVDITPDATAGRANAAGTTLIRLPKNLLLSNFF